MPKPDSDLLKRYFANRCTPEEADAVLTWLATREGQAFYDRYLTRRIENLNVRTEPPATTDSEQTLAGVYNRINSRESAPSSWVRRWYWAAAAIILLALGTWIIATTVRPDERIISVAYGETQRLTLDDGSLVVINAHSTLRYQPDQPRKLWLEGEAYFDVTHTEDDSPFEVHTSDLTVNVLGTEFNVNTRHQKTDVVLRDGRVRLALEERPQSDVVMSPGDKVSYAQRNRAFEQRVVNPDAYTSWTSGTLIFDHTPLGEIFQRMEDTYGVRIDVRDPALRRKEFTGEVAQDQDVLLTLLQKSFGLAITQEGNTIYLE